MLEWFALYPFSLAATNLAVSVGAVGLVLPAMIHSYTLSPWLRAMTYLTFWGGFALTLLNLYLWLKDQGL